MPMQGDEQGQGQRGEKPQDPERSHDGKDAESNRVRRIKCRKAPREVRKGAPECRADDRLERWPGQRAQYDDLQKALDKQDFHPGKSSGPRMR